MDPIYNLLLKTGDANSLYMALWLYVGQVASLLKGIGFDQLREIALRYGVTLSESQCRKRIKGLEARGLVSWEPTKERGFYQLYVYAPFPDVSPPTPPPEKEMPLLDLAERIEAEKKQTPPATSFRQIGCQIGCQNGCQNGSGKTGGEENTPTFVINNVLPTSVEETPRARRKNKDKSNKEIKKEDIYPFQDEEAKRESLPSAADARKMIDFSNPKVERFRKMTARKIWERTLRPDLLDRITVGVVLKVPGFDQYNLERIYREADSQQRLYRDTNGQRGKRFFWQTINLEVKHLFEAAGWVYPATQQGYEPRPVIPEAVLQG